MERKTLVIKRKYLAEFVEHVKGEYPREACGILAGRNREVLKVYPMTNADKSPVTYLMEPKQQFKVAKEIRAKGWEMLGIYHSHPSSSAYPSERDVELAFYPEAVYFVVSLKDFDWPDIKAYSIKNKKIKQQKFEVKE